MCINVVSVWLVENAPMHHVQILRKRLDMLHVKCDWESVSQRVSICSQSQKGKNYVCLGFDQNVQQQCKCEKKTDGNARIREKSANIQLKAAGNSFYLLYVCMCGQPSPNIKISSKVVDLVTPAVRKYLWVDVIATEHGKQRSSVEFGRCTTVY